MTQLTQLDLRTTGIQAGPEPSLSISHLCFHPLLSSSSLSVTLATIEEEHCCFLGAPVNVWDSLSADQVWFIPVLLLSIGGQSIPYRSVLEPG